MKTCSICENKHEAFGYCKRHYRSFKRHGDPLYVDKKREARKKKEVEKKVSLRSSREGTCSVDGCDSPIKSKRLCEKHYARMRRTGSLETKRIERSQVPLCLAANCDKPTVSAGYCETHYSNVKKKGTPHVPRIVKYCGVEGCQELHHAKGVCAEHYNEWKKNLRRSNLIRLLDQYPEI